MTLRATTILNEYGDTTITWTEDRDQEMIEIIRKKMSEGIAFFIIEPRAFGFLPAKKTQLTEAEQIVQAKHRALAIPDEDFRRFVERGSGVAVATPAEATRGAKKSSEPEEIAKAQSVGVKQMRGG